MEHPNRTPVLDLERDDRPLGEQGAVDHLVRLTARFCTLLVGARKKSWFDRDVRVQVRELREDLSRVMRDRRLRIEVDGGTLRWGRVVYEDPPKLVRQLVRLLERKRYAAVVFQPGISELEIVVLCRILLSKRATADPEDAAKLTHVTLEEQAEVDRIRIPEIQTQSRLSRAMDPSPDAGRKIREDVAEITSAIDRITGGSPSAQPDEDDTPSAAGLLELLENLGGSGEIALILSSLRRHDEYTYDHSVNVGLVSICLARKLGMKGRDLQEFGVAALIHDVGKLYTPVEVLNKPGRLSPQEWIQMKRHPRDGYEILLEGGVGGSMAPNIALKHHIAYDGTGYPPLSEDPVEDGAQIVRIADVYDAFTTIRPYRSQSRPREVLKMLRKQGGTMFNPEFIEAFCEMMGEYPIGSSVKLESGNLALVVDVHPTLADRPVVRILQDERGRRPRSMELVELSQKDPETGEYVDGVVETIDPVIRNIPVGRYI